MGDCLTHTKEPKHKPRLCIDQQIEHLKTKGITFKVCSEAAAKDFLACNNYFRTTSYRKLYERHASGPHAGSYINLDFADLIALSRIDRKLRETLPMAAIDIEHFAKERLLSASASHKEDGYAVIADFYASLNHNTRNRLFGYLSIRGAKGEKHDNYTGNIVAHYGIEGLPLWAALEVIEFGTFAALYKFCAERWDDEKMRQEHYILKSVKALRNAVAHNSCIVNGFTRDSELANYTTNAFVIKSMNDAGLKNSKSRRSKMRNLRIAQIAASLWALSRFCPKESCLPRHAKRFDELKELINETDILNHSNDGLVSFFIFLFKLIDIWVPSQA